MLYFNTLENKRLWNNEYLGERSKNLLDKTFRIPLDFDFEVIEITLKYVARPDILSYDAYGDDMYTDIICKLNGISNPFELNEGMLILLPDLNNIYLFIDKNGAGDPIVDTNKSESNLPKPKKKNEKRKANEAVVGDKRFHIDAANKIIIY